MYFVLPCSSPSSEWTVLSSHCVQCAASIGAAEEIKPNSVHMALQIPQYFLMTAGEVVFSVTGLEFSYSQVQTACLQRTWALLNVLVNNNNNNNNNDTVFLSRFGTFFRSEFQFSKPLVQSSHHCVACAHQKSSFSFLWTSCKCFGASIQMIMYNSLFPTLSIAYVKLIKMYCMGLCWRPPNNI